jgi:hypothetical protein
VLGLLALPALAQADGRRKEVENTPAGYRAAIDTALQEVEYGNFEEAREQFARAHALFPNARTLRGLGIAEFELRHYIVAVQYLEQSLASAVKPIEGRMRDETENLLARAKAYTGELRLSVDPGHATLLIDGARSSAVSSEPIRLDVGEHVLEFRAEGFASERRHVTVRGGTAGTLSVQLAALAGSPVGRAETSSAAHGQPLDGPRSEQVPVYKRWWLWTIVGVVVAGAITGTVIALRPKDRTEYRALESENTPMGANLQPLWKF